ncbi:MAG: DUF4118 domain-containing protein [Hyphomicrobiaceae bacterium]|nr:DUF4118 domain-containing protein [Hyphomicrobiaceae bacterium]
MGKSVAPGGGQNPRPVGAGASSGLGRALQRRFKLAYFDFPALLAPVPAIVAQALFALICSSAAVLLRGVTDLWLPSAGPFALTVPTVLVATLFGRWQAGMMCLLISSLHAWYFVLPVQWSFAFADPADGPRVIVNVASGAFVVVLAEVFRAAMRQAIKEREILLLELQHRVKNNFASVSSLLRLQLREAEDESTRRAFRSALGRVESFARANSYLYQSGAYSDLLDMKFYLKELCSSLNDSLGTGAPIILACRSDSIELRRDRAIVVGLLVNEVVTNSFKHAFLGRKGRIDVSLAREPAAIVLSVSDNGRGMGEERREGALGKVLIDALAKQAEATVEIETGEGGTTYTFTMALVR